MSYTETHQYTFSTDDVEEYQAFLEFVAVFDKKEVKKKPATRSRRPKKDDDEEEEEKPRRSRGSRSKKKDDAFEVPSRPNKTNTKALLNRFTEECGDEEAEALIEDWRLQDGGVDDLKGKEYGEFCTEMVKRYEEIMK